MWLLRPKSDDHRMWVGVLSPFVGLSAIVLSTQNLVYVDVPVRTATPWLWIAGVLAWVPVILTGQWRFLRRCFPGALLLCGLLVFVARAAGLLIGRGALLAWWGYNVLAWLTGGVEIELGEKA